MAYTLQILHANDLEGGVEALESAPNFAAIIDTFDDEYANTVILSAGDNYIPGPFFSTAADFSMGGTLTAAYTRYFSEVVGISPTDDQLDLGRGAGRVDISIMNIIGFDASAVGNHEFDPGTSAFADIIGGEVDGSTIEWFGSAFPYLTTNIDFSGDGNLAGLFTSEILDSADFNESLGALSAGNVGPSIAPATVIDRGGEKIGVVGATTQIIETISSTGGTNETTGGSNDMAALAAVIQTQIDALIGDGVNKIIVTSHLQQIELEKELAGLLTGVDVILAGGSNTLQADDNDRLRDGDSADETYPFLTTNADGEPVAIVSTDGEYSYVGRLVVEFDDNGVLIANSIDDTVSGAYATDAQGVMDVTGEQSVADAVATSVRADIVSDLTSAVQAIVDAADAVIYGAHDVFLDGRRGTVRTEESNLGNLTADANLAEARKVDDTVQVSFKNGGGIRAEIGSASDTGTDEGDGELSQLDVQNALRFNNDLTLVTVSAAGFLMMLEHAVAGTDTEAGNTPGRFPQIGGFRFSFDEEGTAQQLVTDDAGDYVVDGSTGLPMVEVPGSRIETVALVDPDTGADIIIVRDGQLTDDAPATIRMVTLDFLVENNGDGYPFQELVAAVGQDIEYVTKDGSTTTDASAANILEEQDALATFMQDNHADEDNAFAKAETDVFNDRRIVQLHRNGDVDRILIDEEPEDPAIAVELVNVLSDSPEEGTAEVVSVMDGVAYVTNGENGRIDVFDVVSGSKLSQFDLTGVPGFDGLQSVAAKGGLIAAAVSVTPEEDNGFVVIFDTDGTLLRSIEVGNLPDMVTFTPDGKKILVANEGEQVGDTDPAGSVSIIDLGAGVDAATVKTLGFEELDGFEDALREQGVMIEPGRAASADLEPEYIAVSPDGTQAFVVLQEANAVAVIDLATDSFVDIGSFGEIDRSRSGFEIDASNRDNAINLQGYDNLYGLRQPDAIATIEIDGVTYVLTANEGDARDDTEDRVKDLDLDPEAFPNADILQRNENLGRLKVRTDIGDTDGDGDYDRLYHYGGRSFTIFNAETGDVVFDSGSAFSQLIAEIRPDLFNQDEGDFDDRSDDKGVEPEAIAAGQVGDRFYAFIGLERDNGVFVADITNPAEPEFVTYIDGEAIGNLSPETIQFIPAEDSATGHAQIAVAYEVSGTTAIYDLKLLNADVDPGETFDFGDTNATAVEGTPGDFAGTSFVNVGPQNSFVFTLPVGASVDVDMATGMISVGGVVFSFDTGNLAGLQGLAFQSGSGSDVKTEIIFVEDEHDLGEGMTVDPAAINGVAAQQFLTSTGGSDLVMTLDNATSGSAFDNIMGFYEIDADGNISDVTIAFGSTRDQTGSYTHAATDFEAGQQIGFFMIQDGATLLGDVSDDTFEFQGAGMTPNVGDGADLQLLVNGTAVTAEVFHSFAANLNSDGVHHVLSGAVDAGTMQFGFEDVVGGDNDYQDVVLLVEHSYLSV
ncbi:MAG: choice-of-anchor I family protein [Marinibacterium sp.]|nr:choice-of-anchor I family protein [Marinibacterium sp.]